MLRNYLTHIGSIPHLTTVHGDHGEPTLGAMEPFLRTATVAHSIGKEVCFYLFALVYFSLYMLKNDKNIFFPLLV